MTSRVPIIAGSVDPRPLQRAAIANGTCIFYWPFDAQDVASPADFRVVTADARGAVGTDKTITHATLGGTATAAAAEYAMRLNTSYAEIAPGPDPAYDAARRLVAGRRETPSGSVVLSDESECYDYYTIDPRTYAYLFVFQYVKETGVDPSFLWDFRNDDGFVSRVDDHLDGARFLYPSGAAAANNITLPAASAAVNGEVRTAGWYYDGTANLRYGFRGVGSGDTVTWSAGTTQNVGGGIPVQDVSGVSSPVGKIQGVLCIEFTTPPLIATVQTAVDQCRANWKAGVKVLPAALLA